MDQVDLTPKFVVIEKPVNLDTADEEYRDEKGRRHREGGPALSLRDGTQIWYHHGKKHRHDGPAVIYSDGHQEWWFCGFPCPKEWTDRFEQNNDRLEHNCVHSGSGDDSARSGKEDSSAPLWQAMHLLRQETSAALEDTANEMKLPQPESKKR